jgi:hypothetical protein
MTVDDQLDAERLGEFVDRLPAMRVGGRRLVRHQDVGGRAPQQPQVVVREDGGAVPAGDAVSPPRLGPHGPAQILRRGEGGLPDREPRIPNLAAEDAAQAGDLVPGDLDDAAVPSAP